MATPQLIVFSGLPGTGKSTLARATARSLGCPAFCKDELHAALLRSGLNYDRAGWMSHQLLTLLAQNQLRLGQSTVIDAMTPYQNVRDDWADVARREGAEFKAVECTCSDPELHRARVGQRGVTIPGWRAVGWDDVLEAATRYEPWGGDHLTVDTTRPLQETLADVLQYLRG